MAGRQRWGRIGFGQISPPEGKRADTASEVLQGLLVPGTAITRYKRTWRIGQNRRVGDCIIGRIGSETAQGIAELWDEKSKDFVPHQVPDGATSPFAINLLDFRIAYQLRAGVFRRQGIMGAFQALLNQAAGGNSVWRVTADLSPITLDAWLGLMDSVDQVWVRIDRPNPHFGARERLKEMIEKSNAASIAMTFKAEAGASVSLDEEILKEAREHVVDENYGEMRLDGRDGDVSERYDTKRGAAPPERKVAAHPETGEADPNDLRHLIGDDTAGE